MSKPKVQASLKFNLDTEQGVKAHYRATRAYNMANSITEILELQNTYIKSDITEGLNNEQTEEKIFNDILEIFKRNNLSIEEIETE